MLIIAVVGSKLAGTTRDALLVHNVRDAAGALAGFAILTRRVARTQRTVSCGGADRLRKVAALPSVVVE